MMYDWCFSTVVDDAYRHYVPIFTYCAKKAYPTTHIRLFMRDPVGYDKYGICYDTIPLFDDFPRYKYSSISLRFLVPPTYYKNYRGVFVTDIDLFPMPDNPPIDEFFRQEMMSTGCCFGNSLRHRLHYEGYNSLTGLHWATHDFFELTEPQRLKFFELHRKGLVGLKREYDGQMLYKMVERSGIKIPPKLKLKRRHRGIHFGSFRLYPGAFEKWASRIPQHYVSAWEEYLRDPLFQRILKDTRKNCKMLDEQLEVFDKFRKDWVYR